MGGRKKQIMEVTTTEYPAKHLLYKLQAYTPFSPVQNTSASCSCLKGVNCFIYFILFNLYPVPTPANRAPGSLSFCVCWHCRECQCQNAVNQECLQNTYGPVEEYSPPLDFSELNISGIKLAYLWGQFNELFDLNFQNVANKEPPRPLCNDLLFF